ncbi:MAG: hypothetical protein HYV27_00860 [Candidatus Hydrogenedentes bacterium]|nr:hypothetical protein [Candidatus Hydrogenedentota bacterium]
MALVTLKKAAELTGKNTSTIHRAMTNGRLSFTKSDAGERLIDVSELDRVFRLKATGDARNDASAVASNSAQSADSASELRELRAILDAERARATSLERDKEDLRSERDRLLRVIEEQATSMKLLTDQRQVEPPAPERRGFLARIFGR